MKKKINKLKVKKLGTLDDHQMQVVKGGTGDPTPGIEVISIPITNCVDSIKEHKKKEGDNNTKSL
ncbi:hypothetical protein BKI52_02190 [marine bacterium AO1-C]|nr:hypothetical protein BKI52_02190 [marine bacterium AO1-C]